MKPFARTWLLPIVLLSLVISCRAKNKEGTEYLAEQIRAGNEQAFRTAERLEDPEAQVALIPALTDAYNGGLLTYDVVELLVTIGHPDGIPVFESALETDDNRLSGLAARGLATVGATDHAGAVANRLRRVRDPNQYEPFLDALRQLPGDPSVAPVIAEIINRPAGSVGGINTIRFGCSIIGDSGTTDAESIRAVLFGLVNFAEMQDATNECALALVTLGEAALPYVFEVLNHDNTTISGYLTQIGFTPEVAGLRAARVLADIELPAALQGLDTWFSTEHMVNAAELSAMSTEAAINWHQNFGQQFIFATEALEYLASPGDEDRAHQILRGLINRGEGMMLENFRWFMGTGADAELGLRSAAIDALVNVGDPADRDVLYQMATSGTLARIPDVFIRKHAAFGFVLLSQPGDLARYDELLQNTEVQILLNDLQVYRAMIEEVVEGCQHDLGCLTGLLTHENHWIQQKAAFDLAHFTENPTAAAAALLDAMLSVDSDMRYTFIRQLRHLPLPQTANDKIAELIEAGQGGALRDYRYQLRVLRYNGLGRAE